MTEQQFFVINERHYYCRVSKRKSEFTICSFSEIRVNFQRHRKNIQYNESLQHRKFKRLLPHFERLLNHVPLKTHLNLDSPAKNIPNLAVLIIFLAVENRS